MKLDRRLVSAWLGLTLVLTVAAYWQAQHSYTQDLSQDLQVLLPQKLVPALHDRYTESDIRSVILEKLDRDLAGMGVEGFIPGVKLLSRCDARVEQLLNSGTDPAAGSESDISIEWTLGDSAQRTAFSIDCQANWPALLGTQSLLALLAVLVVALLPQPLSQQQRTRIADLHRRGVPVAEARRVSACLVGFNGVQQSLFERWCPSEPARIPAMVEWLDRPEVETLSPEQLLWFERGMQLYEDADKALAAAIADNELRFDCQQHRVLVHGIPVQLSKTPFFYLLWYAQRRRAGDGWYLNPPINRPDRETADSLIALMEQYGGHNKAVNDLRENGLRAKTLDQNRNKIRDELVSTLGESLAQPYLFEAERDLKSGRYRYRLALKSAWIHIS